MNSPSNCSKTTLTSINFFKLEGELQPTLGSLGQFLLTKIYLFKLFNYKQHLFKFAKILANEKVFQFLFENQQCQEPNEEKMPQLEIDIHVSLTTLKDI